MLDTRARALTGPLLDRAAAPLAKAGVSPLLLTGLGWLVGVGACVAVVLGAWWVALVLWLGNRLLDGLDGAVARHGSPPGGPSELGGFLDIVADFSIYAGFVLAVAVRVPDARLACVALLVTYYVSGTAFLALSSVLERLGGEQHRDQRSLRFVGGLAEGSETVVAYVVFTLLPAYAEQVAYAFAVLVAITAVQRVVEGVVVLRAVRPDQTGPQ